MSNETTYILIAAASGILFTSIAIVAYMSLRKARYDDDKKKAVLDEIRYALEAQIYTLNERIMKNEERWQDVNHLLIRKEFLEDKPIILNKTVSLNGFLQANGLTESDLIIDRELVFVLTPFHNKFLSEYEIIKKISTDVGFKCMRGDEKYFQSDIFPEMLKLIVKANLIIANLNGRNPNVLYELGIAQALDKPVILISKKPEDLPLDIKSKRFLVYDNFKELESLLKDELIKLLRAQIQNKEALSNKITKERESFSSLITMDFLVGTWENIWTNNVAPGNELLIVKGDGSYFVYGQPYFKIDNFWYDPTTKQIRFMKIATRPNDNRKFYDILRIENENLLVGTEENLLTPQESPYPIQYTRIS